MGDIRHQWIIWICVCEKRQNAEEHLRNCESRTPLILQNIKTDAARCVDIRMIDLRFEGDNGWFEGIIAWKADGQVEDAACEGGIWRSEDHGGPGEEVVL